jgi:hypothetical protein
MELLLQSSALQLQLGGSFEPRSHDVDEKRCWKLVAHNEERTEQNLMEKHTDINMTSNNM